MNNNHIFAWMDDLQMSAQLAKLTTTHSYDLKFMDNIDQISEISDSAVFIIDLNIISASDLEKLIQQTQNLNCTFLGFCEKLHVPQVNYFKSMGCDMTFKRYDLMKNLGSILDNIFNAP